MQSSLESNYTPLDAPLQIARGPGFAVIVSSSSITSQRFDLATGVVRQAIGNERLVLQFGTKSESSKQRQRYWREALDRVAIVVLIPATFGALDANAHRFALDAYARQLDVLAIDSKLNVTRDFWLRSSGFSDRPVTVQFGGYPW